MAKILRSYYINDGDQVIIRKYKTKTIFKINLDKDIIYCEKCNEELGPIDDKNIDHQINYHSCSIPSPSIS